MSDLKRIKITKSVCHPPYNLGYSVGEIAEVAPEMFDKLVEEGRGVAITEKVEKAAEKAAEKKA